MHARYEILHCVAGAADQNLRIALASVRLHCAAHFVELVSADVVHWLDPLFPVMK